MKKFISILLCAVVIVTGFSAVQITSFANTKQGWESYKYYDEEQEKEYTFWFYYDENGKMATGWKMINGVWYFFENEDERALGLMYSDEFYYDEGSNALYRFSKSGAMLANSWYAYREGDAVDWYYFTSNGKAASGWQKVGSYWYYFNTNDFSMYSDGTAEINGKIYMFEKSGAMHTGWINPKGYWWYFKPSGELARGWVRVKGTWYYFAPLDPNDAESMAIGWRNINNKWYYFNNNGAMLTGWVKVGNYWYYLNDKGAMLTGWISVKGTWYYLESSGRMRTANLDYKGKTYRFSSSGACLNP